ncbi:DHH family phosphoesterase [Paenibacillus pini]|uniref:Exonuclease n=1 Tax=Paenibacillus pini JCM 16418 TaxID=1236976 RepID=W7Z8G1_9BACL|nr:DHH family phosphoesterase [Paenibacillus pini]GAF10709.1 exonuclease [Paenibacillus pini JCM 16418]
MKKWRQREPALPYDENDTITKKLACIYGISDIDEFLNPSVRNIHHYSLLKNLEEVVNLILLHISKDHEIIIFADIDHDGALSGAIMYRYLRYLSAKVRIIHKQRRDGHGLNTAEDVIDPNTRLLVAIDSSTNDVDSCERIRANGTNIIIIDHHKWEGKDNTHALIVNPQMPDCDYPNHELSGGMVAYKVCQALDDYTGGDYAEEMVDMAGLSLLADSMSALEPENRYYIDLALKNVKNLGLKTLLNELKVDTNTMDSNKFVYSVSPCVSAITRKNEFEKAIGLYISDDPIECLEIAKELINANKERKIKQKQSYQTNTTSN